MRTYLTATAALALSLLVPAASAQQWELGATAGGSFATKKTLTNGTGSAEASFETGRTYGVWAAQNMYERLGGEIHYRYLDNDLKLSSGGTKATFAATAHALHYDFTFHVTDREATVRPYFIGGAGIKYFQGRGTTLPAQPLSRYALFTDANQLTPLTTFGVGVKFRIGRRVIITGEFREYYSPFPDDIVVPNVGTTKGGAWIHNFVPSIGLGFLL